MGQHTPHRTEGGSEGQSSEHWGQTKPHTTRGEAAALLGAFLGLLCNGMRSSISSNNGRALHATQCRINASPCQHT